MNPRIARVGVLTALLLCTVLPGCVTYMCGSDLDCYYAAYGGRRARADMVHGRVASIIDPAAEMGSDAAMMTIPEEPAMPYLPRMSEPQSMPPDVMEPPQETTNSSTTTFVPPLVGPTMISPVSGKAVNWKSR